MDTKKILFDDRVKNIILNMSWDNGGKLGVIEEQLEREEYLSVKNVLEKIGGKWSRKKQGTVFDSKPDLSTVKDGYVIIPLDDFFETPETVIYNMTLHIYAGGRTLEPSAGRGAIVDFLVNNGRKKHKIVCIEEDKERAKILQNKQYNTIRADFLSLEPHDLLNHGIELFDNVIMNPPFSKKRDIDHVRHAYKFLANGGMLVSIMSAGIMFRSDHKTKDFRQWLESLNARVTELPNNSFIEAGTSVRTVRVAIQKKSPKFTRDGTQVNPGNGVTVGLYIPAIRSSYNGRKRISASHKLKDGFQDDLEQFKLFLDGNKMVREPVEAYRIGGEIKYRIRTDKDKLESTTQLSFLE